jgi:iron complex outermembrane recepter protein
MQGIIRKAMKTFYRSGKRIVISNREPIKTAIFLLAFILLKSSQIMAQGTLTGFVVDDEFNEPLEKAVVTIPGTLISVLTDQQGKYTMKLKGGDYFMEVNYPGYFKKQYNMSVSDGITTPMFIIKLKAIVVGQTLQRKITSYENKRIFPQSIENVTTWQMTEQTGHQEFNEIFRTIPSVTLLNDGSGFNDSGIGLRGNDETHTSYTFNGILLNNPETGKVSSSILSGMTDWAGQIQVVSGQAANLQNQTNYGGLVNVLSLLPREKAGADLLAIYGNEGFLKTSATVHSGLSKKGLATSIQISRTAGDGLAQNTAFEQYGFFLNVFKEFNQFHTLVFNLNGIIQQHDRNYSDSIGAYNRYGTKYNQNWGNLSEKPLSVSTNYGRSPLISLAHYWRPRIKTHITTQIFAQFDRSAQSSLNGKPISLPLDSIPRDKAGLLIFDRVSEWNKGQNVNGMGLFRLPDSSGKFINSETSGISVLSAIDSETRLGLRTIITRNINKKNDFSGSINLDDYRASHFGVVNNLLGADGYTSYSDVNRPEGFPVENLFQPTFLTKYNSPDKTGYYYQSEIQTGGLSMRLNHQAERLSWYLAGSASMQNIRRTDYFNYLTTDPNKKAESTLLPAGHAQTGINFKFWKYHFVHLNLNYGSYQPLFTTLFPTGNNWKNQEATNEQVFDAEFGYTIFSRRLKVEASAYRSQIANRSTVRYANLNADDAFGVVNGLAEVHQGVELKASYKITRNFQMNVNGSLGDWKYTKDAQAVIYDENKEISSKNELWLKNLRVANAPQFSLFAEAEYRWAHNFYIRLNYYRAEQIFTPLGLYDFKNLAARSDFKQAQIPKYDLIGFSGNYLLKIRKFPELNLIFGGQNLLDTEYIEQSSTNIPEGSSGYTSNQVYYGTGRTWFVGMKVQF